ncbi:MAG: chorismate mutase [Fibrobacter sp.]|nr:chorismate mutase [Fibrobacter sp.]
MNLNNYKSTNPEQLDLTLIASRLESFEETIIASLIDRAQFSVNQIVYQPGKSGFAGESEKSLFSVRLFYQECIDAQFGRFCVPEERPFSDNIPIPQRKVTLPGTGLFIDDYNKISVTAEILDCYQNLIPRLCRPGDDGQWGSSVENDVYAIQSIARRIHYGALYVAETKYRSEPHLYRDLIKKGDTDAIMEKITRKEVEEHITRRVREKTTSIQAAVNPLIRYIIDPDVVVDYYRDTVIPLTKKGEILYLINRQDS